MTYQWKQLGEAGVDSGLLMITDPCYFVDSEGQAWERFLDRQAETPGDYGNLRPQINFEQGHAGRGVLSGTAWGDGSYPVYGLTDGNGSSKALIVLTDELTLEELYDLASFINSLQKSETERDDN